MTIRAYCYGMARDLWAGCGFEPNWACPPPKPTQCRDLRKACLYLEAAIALNPRNTAAMLDHCTVLMNAAIDDPGRATNAVVAYTADRTEDTLPVSRWLNYMVSRQSDRAHREYFLQSNLESLSNYPAVLSDVYLELAHFAQQRGEVAAARAYCERSWSTWPWQPTALGVYLSLGPWSPDQIVSDTDEPVELTDDQITQTHLAMAQRAEFYTIWYWRSLLGNNPFNRDACMGLIDTLESRGYYRIARPYYDHAVKLLNLADDPCGTTDTANSLHRNKLINAFCAMDYADCIQISEKYFYGNRTDLLINSLTFLAMQRSGMDTAAHGMLTVARRIAADLAAQDAPDPAPLAWFYTFVDTNTDLALPYALASLQRSPEDPTAAATAAWCQILSDQWDTAGVTLGETDPNDPVAALALARLEAHAGQLATALSRLALLDRGAGGLFNGRVALLQQHLGQQLLSDGPADQLAHARDAGWLYQEPTDEPSTLASQMAATFDDAVLSIIDDPAAAVQCSLRLDGKTDIYSYGDPMLASIFLSNISSLSLPVGPTAWWIPAC